MGQIFKTFIKEIEGLKAPYPYCKGRYPGSQGVRKGGS